MLRILFKVLAFIMAFCFFASLVFGRTTKYDAFEVKVTGKGQPILLIPGATCSGDEWKETVARLSGKYQCHVFTLAGYAGTAPLPSGPYLETMKTQIKQYMIDKKLENVILIGHSLGGFLSLCMASEMNDRLQKVIVVDAMPFFAATKNPNATDTFSETMAQKVLEMYKNTDDKKFFDNQMSAARFLCRDSTRWNTIATWGATSDKKTFAYTITEMMSSDIRKKISAIKVPVLVLAAYCKMPEYKSYTRDWVIRNYSDQYKACTTCTIHTAEDNTKHFIMYDAPDWYFSEIRTFLNTKL